MRAEFWIRAVWGIFLAGIFACLITLTHDPDSRSSIKRGDFPAFYSLAVLADTDPAHLYDFEKQREVQNRAWPSLEGQFFIASYPPYTAWMTLPLAWLKPAQGKLCFTIVMLGALYFSARLLRRINPALNTLAVPPELLLFLWAPLATATIGGQNTALSLLLLCSAIYFLKLAQNQEHRQATLRFEFCAGIALGLMSFKPQYGLPLVLAAGALGRWRVLWGTIPVFALFYGLAVKLLGWDWLWIWGEASLRFAELNLRTNGYQIISVLAGARELSQLATGNPSSLIAPVTAILLSLVIAISLLNFVIKLERPQQSTLGLALTAGALTLLTPQTTFYDIGLFAVALLLLTPAVISLTAWSCLMLASAIFQGIRPYTTLPLFFLLALVLYGWIVARSANNATGKN